MTRRASSEYAAKFKDPRWQEKRLRIMGRDRFECQVCYGEDKTATTLHVHHRFYRKWGTDPWDYPDEALVTMCEACHEEEGSMRAEAQQMLVEAVMSSALSVDVYDFAEMLQRANAQYRGLHESVIHALTYWLRKPDKLQALLLDYYRGHPAQSYVEGGGGE